MSIPVPVACANRRSIYPVVWRGIPDPFMEAMDFPDLGLLAPKRGFSVSALQSLTLFNNDFVLHGSDWLAQRVAADHEDLTAQIDRAVETAWQRQPSESEQLRFVAYANVELASSKSGADRNLRLAIGTITVVSAENYLRSRPVSTSRLRP